MIGRIAGVLLEKNPPHLLVDCNGVGYEVDVPMSTFLQLAVDRRKDRAAHADDRARRCASAVRLRQRAGARDIRELLKITGIGARMALAVLSGMSVHELAQTVTLQDAARLTRVPGHRQENGRAAAPRTEGEARCRPRRDCRRRVRGRSRFRYPERIARIGFTPKKKRWRPSRTCRPAPAFPKASSSH